MYLNCERFCQRINDLTLSLRNARQCALAVFTIRCAEHTGVRQENVRSLRNAHMCAFKLSNSFLQKNKGFSR